MFGFSSTRRKGGRRRMLHITGSERTAPIAAGETLLRAAMREKISFPHMCNAGECGACRCRLVKGHVRLTKDISRFVSPEELSSGFLLACQSVAESDDVEVEVPGIGRGPLSDPALVRTDATIARTMPLARDIVALELSLDAAIHYRAGQYAELHVPGVPGLDQPRCYSFAEAPGRSSPCRALFHVRHVPGGAFTDWLFGDERAGARVRFSGPHGRFRYHDANRPLLCVAGGTGLSPIKAILEQGLSEGLARDVTLVVGARTQKDLYALDAIAAIAVQWRGQFAFVPVLSEEPEASGWRGQRGLVTAYLHERAADLAGSAAYLCGPPRMIDAALHLLRDRIPPEHVHFDRFLDRGSAAHIASRPA